MRILTRYVLRLHLAPFFFSLAALTMVLLLDQVGRQFEKLVGKGLHWTVIGEVFLYSVPFILAQTFPMAVLIAVLYSFNRLAGDNEITAMKASGIPLTRLLAPLVLVAALAAAGMFWFNDTVLPESNHRLQVLRSSIAQKMPTFELREQTINEVLSNRLYLQAARIDRGRSALEDVVIYDERLPSRSRTIYADSGGIAFNDTQTDLYLTLHGGVMQEQVHDKPGSFGRLFFDRLVMRVQGVSNELERSDLGGFRGDREMSVEQLEERVDASRDRARGVEEESRIYARSLARLYAEGDLDVEATEVADSDSVDVREGAIRMAVRRSAPWEVSSQFNSYRMQVQSARSQASRFAVEIHKKASIPAACIVFVLIGAPIALRWPLGGVALVVAVSFGVFVAYYVALVGGEELADSLILSPFWSMWAPNVLFGLIGAGFVWRARKAGR